jgi:hypothetical protein
MRRRALLAAWLCGAAAGSAAAAPHVLPAPATDPLSGVTLTLSTCFWDPPPTGMMALRVAVENDASRPREWTLHFDAAGDYGGTVTYGSAEAIQVPAGATREFELSVPIRASISSMGFSSTMHALFDGPAVSRERVPLFMNRHYLNSSAGERALTPWIGMSESLATAYWEPTKTALLLNGQVLAGSRFDPACLPADWRSYLGFTALALTADEWRDLSAAPRLAVERWVARGGRLWIAGDPPGSRRLGSGTIVGLPDVRSMGQEALAEGVRALPPINDDYQSWSLITQLGAPDFPKGLMLAFIGGFGLLVGPVNLFAFCRGPNRYRILWTTPLLSIVASALITAGILLHDGTGGTGLRQAVVELLPARHEEIVLQEQLARTGLLLGSRFRTADAVWMEPIEMTDSMGGRPSGRVQRAGDTFSGAWFSSRALHGQYLESVRPSRARFEISGEATHPRVVSSLPDTLEDVYLIDRKGAYWHATRVEPGRGVDLTAETEKTFRSWLTGTTPFHGPRLRRAVQPGPGMIFAGARRTTAAVATLASLTWTDRETLYVQRLD